MQELFTNLDAVLASVDDGTCLMSEVDRYFCQWRAATIAWKTD